MSAIKCFIKVLCLLSLLSACQTTSADNQVKTNFLETDIPLISADSDSEESYHPIFEPISLQLATNTNLSIILPSYLPEYTGGPALNAILVDADNSGYEIMLAYTPDCPGINACRLGKIKANIVDDSFSLDGEQIVTLNNGVEAYFTDGSCNAYCTDSTLMWKDDSVVHTVGIKAGKIEMLVKIANTME